MVSYELANICTPYEQDRKTAMVRHISGII